MKKEISAFVAHVFALITILLWGTSFIATKFLLDYYTPLQIMMMRFVLAYFVLWLIRPKLLKVSFKTEMNFALLGFTGCTLYFLGENNALRFTLASNVSIIVATAPIFIAVLSHLFLKNEKLTRYSFIGFIVAIVGVALVVFNGSVILKLNPIGDILSLFTAFSWAIYSVLLRKNVEDYDSILLTRRLMFWGFITALPFAIAENKAFSFAPLGEIKILLSVLFLAFICSGFCYVLWNIANSRLGTVTVGNYVYLNPLSTMLVSGLVLHEPISAMAVGGTILILLGIFVADRKPITKEG